MLQFQDDSVVEVTGSVHLMVLCLEGMGSFVYAYTVLVEKT